jgi:hypothetical protein
MMNRYTMFKSNAELHRCMFHCKTGFPTQTPVGSTYYYAENRTIVPGTEIAFKEKNLIKYIKAIKFRRKF